MMPLTILFVLQLWFGVIWWARYFLSLGHRPLSQRCVVAWEQIAISRSRYTSFGYTIPLTKLFSECVQLASGKRDRMIQVMYFLWLSVTDSQTHRCENITFFNFTGGCNEESQVEDGEEYTSYWLKHDTNQCNHTDREIKKCCCRYWWQW